MEQTQLEKTINQYLDKLIEKKGLSSAPEADKEDFRNKMQELIAAEYNKELLRRLPDDKLDEFNAVLDDDSKTEENLGAIIEAAGIDESAVLEFVLDNFSEEFLSADINNKEAEA